METIVMINLCKSKKHKEIWKREFVKDSMQKEKDEGKNGRRRQVRRRGLVMAETFKGLVNKLNSKLTCGKRVWLEPSSASLLQTRHPSSPLRSPSLPLSPPGALATPSLGRLLASRPTHPWCSTH